MAQINPTVVIISTDKLDPDHDAEDEYREWTEHVFSTREHGTIWVRMRDDGSVAKSTGTARCSALRQEERGIVRARNLPTIRTLSVSDGVAWPTELGLRHGKRQLRVGAARSHRHSDLIPSYGTWVLHDVS